MRVLTFTTLFPNRSYPNQGIFVRERTRHVAERCDIEVVAPVPASLPLPGRGRAGRLAAVPRKETIAGLTVHHPRYFSIPGGWPRIKPRSIASGAWPTVKRLHSEAPFDLIDAHFAHPDGRAAARLANWLKIPFVLSLRGSDIHRDMDRPRLRPLILETVRLAAAVIAVAGPLADRLREAGADETRLHVIPNGIDAARFAPRDRAEARAEIGATFDGRLIFAAGSLLPIKGFDVLIDAFAEAGLEDTRLWIAGEGPMHRELERRAERRGIAGRVRFVGSVPHERMPAYYAAADGFVLSSRNEGCPNVLLEALASGCAVVASEAGHVPALLGDSGLGRLVPPEDVGALAEALRSFPEPGYDRAPIRALVENLTWERVAQRVRDVFSAALADTDGKVTERVLA